MQINGTGKNKSVMNAAFDMREMQDKKSRDNVSEQSFYDRLQKNMDAKAASISSKNPKGIGIRAQPCENRQAAQETDVRRIPYSECDRIEINILEGCALKAKLEADGCSVYVEMKNEDGIQKACLFHASSLRRDSGSAMERIAYETLKSMREKTPAAGRTVNSSPKMPADIERNCYPVTAKILNGKEPI